MKRTICTYEDNQYEMYALCYREMRGDTEIDCDKCEVKIKSESKDKIE